MRRWTVDEARAALADELAKVTSRLDVQGALLAQLPADLPAPTLSNEHTHYFGTPAAWLSWSSWPGAATPGGWTILDAIERAGWQPLPVTLAKWGSWRALPEPGLLDELPETKNRDTLIDVTPIAPLWIEPNQHTGTEARAFYRTPDAGRIVKISVPGPCAARITAQRVEPRGTWYYKHGTARLIFPDAWHAIRTADGNAVAGIAAQSRAYVDTEQGISGAIYFDVYTEQSDFPLTPAAILRQLEGGPA